MQMYFVPCVFVFCLCMATNCFAEQEKSNSKFVLTANGSKRYYLMNDDIALFSRYIYPLTVQGQQSPFIEVVVWKDGRILHGKRKKDKDDSDIVEYFLGKTDKIKVSQLCDSLTNEFLLKERNISIAFLGVDVPFWELNFGMDQQYTSRVRKTALPP